MARLLLLMIASGLFQNGVTVAQIPTAVVEWCAGVAGGVKVGIEDWDTIHANGSTTIRFRFEDLEDRRRTNSMGAIGYKQSRRMMDLLENGYLWFYAVLHS